MKQVPRLEIVPLGKKAKPYLMKSYLVENALLSKLSGLERKKYLLAVKVLKFCYFNGSKSIADICKYLKVSSPNGISLLNDLMDKGLMEKKGFGASKGGRKPELYGIVNNVVYVLAIDMDIFQTRMTIFNSANENVVETKTYDIELNNEPHTLEVLINYIEEFITGSGIDRFTILGIGLSVPGLVDSRKGVNYTYLYFGSKPVRDIIQERIKIPVFVENDAKAIALSVWRFGVARGRKDVLVLFLNWGIGLGMILDGKLYRGASGFAGEFSHIPIVEDGELCICGKLGCLQTVAAGTTLVKMAKDGIAAGKSSMIALEVQGDLEKITINSVVHAAMRGDQFAISILSKLGKNLGKGIAILIQLFNPEMIVLGGKMAESGNYLTTPIQQAINTYTMSQISSRCAIETSKMGDDIGLRGAMAVVMEDVFEFIVKK